MKGLRSEPSFKLYKYHDTVLWKLAEGTRLLGQRQRTSWRHSKQHVLRVQVASCSGWFLSPFAVVTKDHSLSDLKQPTSVLLQFSSAEVRDQ